MLTAITDGHHEVGKLARVAWEGGLVVDEDVGIFAGSQLVGFWGWGGQGGEGEGKGNESCGDGGLHGGRCFSLQTFLSNCLRRLLRVSSCRKSRG